MHKTARLPYVQRGAGREERDDLPSAATVLGVEMDGKTFEELLPIIEQARERGAWLVLAGHDIGDGGRQTTRVEMLERLIEYAQDPSTGVWLAPVGEVAAYIEDRRSRMEDRGGK